MKKRTVKCGFDAACTVRGKFLGAEGINHFKYGAELRLRFKILTGPFARQEVWAITAPLPHPANDAGEMWAALADRPLTLDEKVDFNDFVGREYILALEEGPGGGLRVVDVSPVESD